MSLFSKSSLHKLKTPKKPIGLILSLKGLTFSKLASATDYQFKIIGDKSRIETRSFYVKLRQLFNIVTANQVYMKNQNFIQNLPKVEQFSKPESSAGVSSSTPASRSIPLYRRILLFFEVWLPTDIGLVYWNILIMFFIFTQMLMIPLMLSYDPTDDFFYYQDQVVNYCFILDILFQFNIAIYIKGSLQTQRMLIFKEYLKCWFWIDLLSSFPYDQIFESPELRQQAQLIRFLRFFKFIKVVRLLRALKLKKIFARLEEFISLNQALFNVIQILKLFILIMCISHWCSCVWNLFLAQDHSWGTALSLTDQDWPILYITSIYYTTTTIITVGYGDIHAFTVDEMVFAIFLMLLASAVFGYTTNIVMALVVDHDSEFTSLQNDITKYMKSKKLDNGLQSRVRSYLEWLHDKQLKSKKHESTLLTALSANLRSELVCLINGRVVAQISFFEEFTKHFNTNVAYALHEQVFGPEEIVFHENTIGQQMYYIVHGNVAMMCGKSEVKVLKSQSYFGEIGFLCDLPRSAAALTKDFVIVLALDREKFLLIAQQQQVDFERYHEIKYLVGIEEDYSVLEIQCYLCEEFHPAKFCPKGHFVAKPLPHLGRQRRPHKRLRVKSKPFHHYLRNKEFLRGLRRLHISMMKHHLQGRLWAVPQYQEHSKEQGVVQACINFEIDSVRSYEAFRRRNNVEHVIARVNEYVDQRLELMELEKNKWIQELKQRVKRQSGRLQDMRFHNMPLPKKQVAQKFQKVCLKMVNSPMLQKSNRLQTCVGIAPVTPGLQASNNRLLALQSSRQQLLLMRSKSRIQEEYWENPQEEGVPQKLFQFRAHRQQKKVATLKRSNSETNNQNERIPFGERRLLKHMCKTLLEKSTQSTYYKNQKQNN